MHRTRITLAGLALALSATVAGAQQTTPPQSKQPKAGQQADSAHRGRHAKRGRPGARMAQGRQHARQARVAAFRGVELTEAQRTKLRAIREQHAAQAKPIAQRMRPAMQEARTARQRGDTAAARAAFERTASDRAELKAIGERQRAAALAVLTPEQRAKVEANAKARRQKGEAKRQAKQAKRARKAQG